MRDNAKFDYYKVDFDLIIIRSVWDNFLRKLQSSKFVIPPVKEKNVCGHAATTPLDVALSDRAHG